MAKKTSGRRSHPLAKFLVGLVVDDDLRTRFAADPEATARSAKPRLNARAVDAILGRNRDQMLELIANNENASTASRLSGRKTTKTGKARRKGSKA